MKRRSKWYFKNEKETLRSIGLRPVLGSGSGWVDKEDGENEYILAQLKSTSAESYRVSLVDLDKLEYHASNSNKIPLFLIQFIECGRLYALVRMDDLQDVVSGLGLSGVPHKRTCVTIQEEEAPKRKVVKSSTVESRESFYEGQIKTCYRGCRKDRISRQR